MFAWAPQNARIAHSYRATINGHPTSVRVAVSSELADLAYVFVAVTVGARTFNAFATCRQKGALLKAAQLAAHY